MTTAWNERAPIYNRLPLAYRLDDQHSITAKALVSWVDEILIFYLREMENYDANFLIPQLARDQNLDWLAAMHGWRGEYWNTGWASGIKRILIERSAELWERKGDRRTLQTIYGIFGLDVTITSIDGWILSDPVLGELPQNLGSNPFDWEIRMADYYTPGTRERTLVEKLANLWLPCWYQLTFKLYSEP